ncbi:MAG: 50S ribosomal protein L25 [Candidatus Eisenbacteria bacterium]
MATVEMAAEARTAERKGGARKVRAAGKIPCIIYGSGGESLPIAIDMPLFEQVMRHASENVIVDVKLKGQESRDLKAIIKEVQRDPRNARVLHIDFQHIDMTKKVRLHVPVVLKGTAHGVKEGGVLEHVMRTLEVECLPTEIPNEIAIDISALDRGQSIHIRDLDLPGIHLTESPERTVVAILTKAKDEALDAAATAAAAATTAAPAAAAGKAAPAAKADAKPDAKKDAKPAAKK